MKQATPSLRKGQQRLDKHNEHDKKEESLTSDLLVLPSTSTFALKDDKQEKLKKKARNFLDEKQKIKTRAQSLWAYIDATNSFDQARFFQENAEQVFQVVYDTCIHQIEKIKHRSERPQSWNSKELVNLQKTLFLLRKIFLFVPELMRNGWQRQNITTILTHILDHRNHPRLRALGFQLLLLWLNDQVVEYPECMHLFSNAISLDLFILDEISTADTTQTPHNAPAASTATTSTNNASYISPVTVNLMTNEQTEDNTTSHNTLFSNGQHNKLHSGGLQFVKKLRETTHVDKGHNKHALQRDERIRASQIQLKQSFILADESSAPLFPNPTQPTFNDSLVLIHIFISNLVRLAYVAAGSPPPPDDYEYPPGDQFEPDDGIATGVGIDAATASAKFLFKIFRTHYMTKFVPRISKSLQMEGANQGEVCGFSSCPPSILRCLFRFLIGYCLDNDSNGIHMHWPNLFQSTSAFAPSSPAIPILKSIVLSSHETREMLHEIIRQALILPCTNAQYRDITRGAIHILGVWILGNEDERPSFLRRSGSAVTRSSSTTSAISANNAENSSTTKVLSTSPITEDFPINPKNLEEQQSDANVFLRRYLLMIKLIFEDHRVGENRDALVANVQQVTDWEGLVALYKDAINLYRAIVVSKGGIDIEWESWELLLHCLLDIQQWLMSQPEKYSRIPVQPLAEDLASYIWETVFHAFVRAKIVHLELWRQLKTHVVSSMRWTQALQQWVKIMQSLTRLLSSRLYKVEYDFDKGRDDHLQQSIHFINSSRAPAAGNNNKSKVRSRHLSIQGHPKSSVSTGNKRGSNPGRPLSSCGSEGQLATQDRQPAEQQHLDPTTPAPEGSVSTILRNLSSASLSDIASTFKSDRKSTNLTSVPDDEEAEVTTKQNVKFGIKNIIPTASFSNTSSHTSGSIAANNLTSSTSTAKRSSGSHAAAGTVSSTNEKTGRRTISIQQLDSLWQDSGSKLLNFVHHGNDGSAVSPKNLTVRQDEKKTEWDRRSGSSSVLDDMASSRSNRTSTSAPWPLANVADALSMMPNSSAVTEKLPAGLGSFKSSDFLNLNNLPFDGQHILMTWKNALFVVGNINQIEGAQNHAIAMQCVVDILDTFKLVRAQQPYTDVPIPAMYELVPWLFEATELPNTYEAGKASAYGSLCRLMSHIPEEQAPEGYCAAFYKALLHGLGSESTTAIVHAILLNSERLFSFPLPSIYVLIPPFTEAIEKELLNPSGSKVSLNVRKSCITILGSFVPISNQLKDITISLEELETEWIPAFKKLQAFSFANIKVWLKDVLIKLVANSPKVTSELETEVHCMLLGALCAFVLDEMFASESRQNDMIRECVQSLVNHLYWCNISIINTVSDCISTFAQIYKREADPEGIVIQEVLTHIIDALNVHLKYYEKNSKTGRGFIVSKLFSCLLEWVMSIEPVILVETDLCQLVFDVIELAIHLSSDGNEKMLPHPPRPSTAVKRKEISFKFKLGADKRPDIQQNEPIIGSDTLPDNDQAYVKESAEAVLLHLLHHFNNFAPPCGPATLYSTIVGPGVSQDDVEYQQYQYFAFNDTTIIAFVELSEAKGERQARMIIRDLTGRYVWDTLLEPKTKSVESTQSTDTEYYKPDKRFIRNVQDINDKPLTDHKEDAVSALLKQIGDSHPDCLLDSTLPLNVPSTPTALQLEMIGNLGDQLDDYLKKEAEQNALQTPDSRLWYSKMNMLRGKQDESMQLVANFCLKKDFLPAFPQEAEESHVPFLYSRLLMSHLGLIEYDHLKDGSFQMLNKSPALYRDIRGLDRKHGRETMKIGLIYVGYGQEDEQSILQNSQGSERYNAFVNSLGWEIDIASHTGYLGGLERNLTNGSRATYYCSSTLEMIFHDVTKMPTDPSDPKQLKKKRHIGNDHVHIVWNEHARDYRIDTIGGDFGNAQIIVKPLPDNLYYIQIYRDSKVPYFGPLYDRMIVSQASLGPLVRSTAIDAFRATVHTNLYSFYKSVYAQRASDIRTINQRHKLATWSYQHFMEKVFMLEEQL
ncbi:hypothetical protein G6F46_002102 [Rhizopus delemar]|uniref:Rap-GAP domain-containing protein n=1 Tax=Rhizopus oryzae TaxID=64495 RepID=A0A9P6YKN0_RHIOR|nr:hypothetical protein G6F55_002592 [Rhizopus delemar]KAG1551081.1 hypothetical protein G6F51_002058 [Rhizopus arrhizus]KAG1505013.1 hypothetical protein G6F54_000614 [Rhizopus delemar]KAG1516949.1 hypothetical protein G6F53_001759 [Rhizopus delemar]KAG1526280.1 hypothetical protein G6F52_002574 [Rhizopus delemar]